MKLILFASILSLAAAVDFGRAGNGKPGHLRSLEVEDEVVIEIDATLDVYSMSLSLPAGIVGPGDSATSKGSKSSKGYYSGSDSKSSKGHYSSSKSTSKGEEMAGSKSESKGVEDKAHPLHYSSKSKSKVDDKAGSKSK